MEEETVVTQKAVVEAVHDVTRMFPGWTVPKEFIDELYTSKKVNETEGGLKEQIEALGDHMKTAYLCRYVRAWRYGTRLAEAFFRLSDADEVIRLVSWSQSAQRGVLISHIGTRL